MGERKAHQTVPISLPSLVFLDAARKVGARVCVWVVPIHAVQASIGLGQGLAECISIKLGQLRGGSVVSEKHSCGVTGLVGGTE